MKKDSQIFIAGIHGLVGSAVCRELKKQGFTDVFGSSHSELDLTNQSEVYLYFAKHKPEYVILAAAKVGGIHANKTYPAQFIFSNICIQNNIIHGSYMAGVKKLLFLGSSCIYPKFAEQPINEDSLLSDKLEPTNDAYAIAKIAGIKMCQSYNLQYGTNFISCMPTNLYGINDNYDPMNSHVLPAMIRRFHESKIEKKPIVEIWGDGTPLREFLYADDLAEACVFLMETYNDNEIINIGSGVEIKIGHLAKLIKDVVGYKGEIKFNTNMPNGTPRKFLNSSKINELGWYPNTSLEKGIELAYKDFLIKSI